MVSGPRLPELPDLQASELPCEARLVLATEVRLVLVATEAGLVLVDTDLPCEARLVSVACRVSDRCGPGLQCQGGAE